MKFGKANSVEELDRINWALPKTHIDFTSSNTSKQIKISSGGTMWNIKPWRGSVYPEKDPIRTWPQHYGAQFGNIEFNATHYKIYSPEKMAQWSNIMPEGFKFCPKFPAIISHYRRFNNCDGPTDDFIKGLLSLGEKLGPAFLQLPPQFSPKQSDKLLSYLDYWPNDLKMAIEFRHPLWFEGGAEAEMIWDFMSKKGIGAVISDTATRRDALHMRITAPFVLMRFGGYSGHKSDTVRMANWANWIMEMSQTGLESFYLLVHQTDSIHTPKTCIQFSEIVREKFGVNVKCPNLY